jgi:hypothetical protein
MPPSAVYVNDETTDAAEGSESMSEMRAISSKNTGAAQALSKKVCNCVAQDDAGDARDIRGATNSDLRHPPSVG